MVSFNPSHLQKSVQVFLYILHTKFLAVHLHFLCAFISTHDQAYFIRVLSGFHTAFACSFKNSVFT